MMAFASAQPELTFSSATEVSPRVAITIYDIVEARNVTEQLINEMKSIKIAKIITPPARKIYSSTRNKDYA